MFVNNYLKLKGICCVFALGKNFNPRTKKKKKKNEFYAGNVKANFASNPSRPFDSFYSFRDCFTFPNGSNAKYIPQTMGF